MGNCPGSCGSCRSDWCMCRSLSSGYDVCESMPTSIPELIEMLRESISVTIFEDAPIISMLKDNEPSNIKITKSKDVENAVVLELIQV